MNIEDLAVGNGTGNRIKLSRKEYLIYGGAGLAFLGLIVLYVFEFAAFDRTLEVKGLLFRSAYVGLLIGVLLGYFFRDSGKDLTEKVQIFVFFILITIIFITIIISLIILAQQCVVFVIRFYRNYFSVWIYS